MTAITKARVLSIYILQFKNRFYGALLVAGEDKSLSIVLSLPGVVVSGVIVSVLGGVVSLGGTVVSLSGVVASLPGTVVLLPGIVVPAGTVGSIGVLLPGVGTTAG